MNDPLAQSQPFQKEVRMDRQDEQQQYQNQQQQQYEDQGHGSTAQRSGRAPGDAVAGYAVVDIWTFTLPEGLSGLDLTGYSVEATDGGIGKVDEATKDAGSSYL